MAAGSRRHRPVGKVIDGRIGLLFGLFMLLLVVALARASYLGLVRAPSLRLADAKQQVSSQAIPAIRGTITDRNGVVLALSEAGDEVIADPVQIKQPQVVATKIAPLLGLSELQVYAALTKPGTQFSIVDRYIPAATATEIQTMQIDGQPLGGITMEAVAQRVYPRGALAGQVLGWMWSNGRGAGGIEDHFNSVLSGRTGLRRTVYDAVGQPISVDTLRPMESGKTVALTISAPLQSEVEQVLAWVGREYSPKAATAIVMNPDNGQVLALGNWPFVNSNAIGSISATEDYAVGLSYEPGSTFKAITVSGALQDGVVTPDTVFDVPPYLDPYGRMITDAEPHGYEDLTVADILKVSSNIGADLIGQKMGATNFSQWVNRFGFGQPTGIALPGEQDE